LELQAVGYKVPDPIKLSKLMHEIQKPPFSSLFVNGKRAPVEKYMDAGTSLRRTLGRADALAMYAVRAIRGARSDSDRPADGEAFILDSLKHDAEVETLRRIYGPAFIAIGIYAPYRDRKEFVKKRLFDEKDQRGFLDDCDEESDHLIDKDEEEKDEPYGQHVSEAFALCDIVVTSNSEAHIRRIVRLLFGDWTKTPTRDEIGMYHAQGAAFQSSSMARQVGAAICRDGAILATGTNEVPRYGGGLFDVDALEEDGQKDPRDFQMLGYDTSDQQRRELLVDLLERLCRAEVITSFAECDAQQKAKEFLGLHDPALNKTERLTPILKRAKFMSTIDQTFQGEQNERAFAGVNTTSERMRCRVFG
jgi:deoxycytidylate deaminase